jgi:RNA recognition motif-containing protein
MDVSTRIHVLGLPQEMREATLLQLFSRFGTVKSARLVTDVRGNSLRMGLVEMSHDSEIKAILKRKNRLQVLGKRLMVWQPSTPAVLSEKFHVDPSILLPKDKVWKTTSDTKEVANFGKAATVFHKALNGSVAMTDIQLQFITTQLYALQVALTAHQSKHHGT